MQNKIDINHISYDEQADLIIDKLATAPVNDVWGELFNINTHDLTSLYSLLHDYTINDDWRKQFMTTWNNK